MVGILYKVPTMYPKATVPGSGPIPTADQFVDQPNLYKFLAEHDVQRLIEYYSLEMVMHTLSELAQWKAEHCHALRLFDTAEFWLEFKRLVAPVEKLSRAIDFGEENELQYRIYRRGKQL